MRLSGLIGLFIAIIVIFIVANERNAAGIIDWYDDSTIVAQREGGNFIGGNGIDVAGVDAPSDSRVNFTLAADLLTAGSDGDSSTVESDSGLEFVGGFLSLLRGCADNEIIKWDDATDDDWNCEADAGGGGHTIQDEGTPLTARTNLNFTGGGITCTDDGPSDATDCDVPTGGGATITVQKEDVTVDAAVSTLDFQSGFDVTSAPAGEANIALDTSESPLSGLALLVGRSGGQILIGGTAAGDDLTLETTSNGSKGSYIFSELDCTSNTQGGALTADGSGVVTCSDDNSVILDLADDDSNESDALVEIAITGDTNSIFTESAADKLLIAVANSWPTATETLAVVLSVQKESAGTINAEQVVYLAGFDAGDAVPTVELARSDSASTMAAVGVAIDSITNLVSGRIVLLGNNVQFDTTGMAVGDALYVDPSIAGDLTTTKPTGTNLIQKFAEVVQVGASGNIYVFGAGRANDVPNIPDDNVWVGSSSAVATATAIGDCDDPNHLNYDITTNAFSCGTPNIFSTMNAPAGTDPVADSATDTLNFTVTGTDFTITGDSSTDTLDFAVVTHAGTDITADLEEETHVTEHQENGDDELLNESLGTACTDNQFPQANATGGIDCHTFVAADISDQHAGTDITADLEEEAHNTEHATGGDDILYAEHGITFSQAGDVSTTLEVEDLEIPMWRSGTINDVECRVATAPTTSAVTVDVNLSGTTIFTTQGNRPSIAAAANEDTSGTPDVTSFDSSDYFDIDVDATDSGNTASDLVCVVRVRWSVESST